MVNILNCSSDSEPCALAVDLMLGGVPGTIALLTWKTVLESLIAVFTLSSMAYHVVPEATLTP